jgi:hypothetical protein
VLGYLPRPDSRKKCSEDIAQADQGDTPGAQSNIEATIVQEGWPKIADNGTLLLDEIAELPLALQPKLLRALQEREFERVGGTRTIKSDVRIVCSTAKNLGAEVKKGAFREDLFHRLRVIPFKLPPLRKRKDVGTKKARCRKSVVRPFALWGIVNLFRRVKILLGRQENNRLREVVVTGHIHVLIIELPVFAIRRRGRSSAATHQAEQSASQNQVADRSVYQVIHFIPLAVAFVRSAAAESPHPSYNHYIHCWKL